MLKLIIKEPGQDARDFQLESKEYVLGSGKKCDIVLKDDKVSDRHAKLFFRKRNFIIKALSEESVVTVNDSIIETDTELVQGDEIKLGRIKIEMEIKESDIDKMLEKEKGGLNDTWESDVNEMRETVKSLSETQVLDARELVIADTLSEKKSIGYLTMIRIQNVIRRNRRWIIGGILLVFIAYIVSVISREGDDASKVRQDKAVYLVKPPSTEDEVADKAATIYFKAANEFMEKHLWEEAAEKYQRLLAFDPEHPDAGKRLAKAKEELNNRELLEKGLSFTQKYQYQQGINLLVKIPQDSVYFMRALLEITFARDALKYKTGSKGDSKPASKADITREKGKTLIRQAIANYAGGKINPAIRKLDAVSGLGLPSNSYLTLRASKLAKTIENTRLLFNKGMDQYKNRQFNKSFATCEKVIRLDRKIAGGRSTHYSSTIYANFADTYYKRAKKYYSQSNFLNASKECAKVLRGNPQHRGAKDLNSRLLLRAKKLYQEGYVLESVSPAKAIEKWKQLVQTSLPANEYHKKAKERIAKYEQ
ncbi:MAG: FHA domain-containing protein [Thermodesulfobacteriota bacterium]|nr:FHA domain-containing protein [Thermodesulfobacteriota bacterium]